MNLLEFRWALVAIASVQVVTSLAMLGMGQRDIAVRRWLPYLVSGSAGVLLSTACLDLLPEAVRDGLPGMGVWNVLLGTLLALFCIESCAQWISGEAGADGIHDHSGHPHTWLGEREVQVASSPHPAPLRRTAPGTLLLGSALHSMVDGVAIAAAFAAGPKPGWTATLAVGLHEMPHRLGDFALLLHLGLPKGRAAGAAIGAGAMALVGAVAVAVFGHTAASAGWLLPVSAGSFLYIALVDLLPEMKAAHPGKNVGWQLVFLFAGAVLMAAVTRGEGS